jgi:hypothetical protein
MYHIMQFRSFVSHIKTTNNQCYTSSTPNRSKVLNSTPVLRRAAKRNHGLLAEYNVFYHPMTYLHKPVSDDGMDDRGPIPARSREIFSSSICLRIDSGAHPVSCTTGTGDRFPGDKARPELDADFSPPSSAPRRAINGVSRDHFTLRLVLFRFTSIHIERAVVHSYNFSFPITSPILQHS